MSADATAPDGFPLRERILGGMDFAAYEHGLREYASLVPGEHITGEEREHLDKAGINLQRLTRIARTYSPSEQMCGAMTGIAAPQIWMVISEIWCGDSAQIVPYVAHIAEISPLVTLRILLRDQNPDIMDEYLTGGKRCIPKLVMFSARGTELGRWGPRPRGAQAVVDAALAEGVPKPQRLERLHLWYGRNRGVEIEAELRDVVLGVLKQGIN